MELEGKGWAERIKERGLDRELRGVLRSKLIEQLSGQKKMFGVEKRVICAMILEYLDQEKFVKGLRAVCEDCDGNEVATENEVLEFLKMKQKPKNTFLSFLLETVRMKNDFGMIREKSSQTEISHVEGIEYKIQALEQNFKAKRAEKQENFEEKMQNFQRICEENARNMCKREIERIRTVEIDAVRIEEACKYRTLLSTLQKEQENHWHSQISSLKTKKLHYKSLLIQKKKEFESTIKELQEKYYNEILSFKNSQKSLQTLTEVQLGQAEQAKKTWELKSADMQNKLADIDLLKTTLIAKSTHDTNQLKSKIELELDEEKQRIANQTLELEVRQESLSKKINLGQSAQVDLEKTKKKLQESEKTLKDFQAEYEKVALRLEEALLELSIVGKASKRDLSTLSMKEEEIKILKGEIELYKEMFVEQRERNKRLESSYQAIVQGMMDEVKSETREWTDQGALVKMKEFYKELEEETVGIKKEMGKMVEDRRIEALLSHIRRKF